MKGLAVLFVTILMLIKPLWPVFEYIVNYDYIVNELCENRYRPQLKCKGQCYLAEQLSKESEQNQKNPFGENQTTDIPLILDMTEDRHPYKFLLCRTDKMKKFWPQPNFITLLFVFKKIHPPEL